ncbi:dienelactone hydrolase family protein [Gemmata sp. JC673]|uniref:Dienelactone hydrolase family protein n=1 Tax=Gemmata algarum TaxID=2975278 RepID=A0ABU5F0C5_9BACT|nr:dienelactone hydrolase family protein [Gemmata algarum]MDY3560851.1 dienelactone hydrolase family protein [Gemmata algarum]
MVFWLTIVVSILVAVPPIAAGLFLSVVYLYVRWRYMGFLTRIFQEKPLFVVPRGEPDPLASEVTLAAADGLALRGCYIPTTAPERKGVVLFGLEFGSNRWACRQYCQALIASGYDVFAVETRNQGESERDPNYEPLQWVTDRDVSDMRAAVAYLKSRPDAPLNGIGIFGISKGGSTGLIVAAADPWVKCVVTDGMYGTHTTLVPYMQRWIQIYSGNRRIQKVLPNWFYGAIGTVGVKKVARNRGVTYPSVEKAAAKLFRPLLMIHGAGDTYIKPEMAQTLFARATGRKKLWLVPNAKHNQALHVATDEYNRTVTEFFDRHLAKKALEAVG